MQLGLNALYRFLDSRVGESLVLATVTSTRGASYRKAGAMMLIDARFDTSGLVSGGCLEDDLKEHAREVFDTGTAKSVVYDLSDDESASLWGLGLGCGGTIEVLLERINAGNQFGGLGAVREAFFSGTHCALHKVVRASDPARLGEHRVEAQSTDSGRRPGSSNASATVDATSTTLRIPVSPQRHLLVAGAGPDAVPLVQLAASLDWLVTVVDPRPAYLDAAHFPSDVVTLCATPENVDEAILHRLQAAVIMTHNVDRDVSWLQRLNLHPPTYIGLLGPTSRRDVLLDRANVQYQGQLYGPAGLDIGAVLPEEIALSIIAQIHAVLEGRHGGQLS